MQIVLYEPEIPPNTGNIARTCAAFDLALHLVEPLGFKLENRYLKRAGLDYWPHVRLSVWADWNSLQQTFAGQRLIMATTKGQRTINNFHFESEDILIFGPETRGLPQSVLEKSPFWLRIPSRRMQEGGVRSLNLSTAVGIFVYAALNDCGLLNKF